MTNESRRDPVIDRIREDIVRTGQHVYVVSGGETPRFAYTIGVSESLGAELILAGAIFYMLDEVVKILNNVAAQLKARRNLEVFEVDGLGSFKLHKAHSSWAAKFMLGAFDYYEKRDIRALQIVPDAAHWTIDVPDMSAPWSASLEPVWRWLEEPWTLPVPQDSMATTNLAALRGQRITEVMRWEENEWEMFAGAGPDVRKEDIRVVALGTLIAVDNSLVPVVNLAIEDGLWRDADPSAEWRPWRKRGQETVS